MCGHLWSVGGDGVEDVDEDEEEGDEERHPAGDDVHRNEEGDPGDNHEQSCALSDLEAELNGNGCLKACVHNAQV